MKNKNKKLGWVIFGSWILVIPFIFILNCSGGGSDDDDNNPTTVVDPGISVDPEDSLESFVENTFLDNDINVTVDPTSIEFGETTQKVPLDETFTLKNGSSEIQNLSLSIYGTGGGFRLVEETGVYTAQKPDLSLTPGEDQEFTIEFDASLMGTKTGYIRIDSQTSDNYIILPIRATVTGPADYQVIRSSYFCSSETVSEVDELDFMKVPTGKTETLSIKICNTGGEDITITSIDIKANTNGAASDSLASDPLSDLAWTADGAFNTAFSDYYNPSVSETFEAPEPTTFTGPFTDEASTFSVVEHSTGSSIENIKIESGSYIRLDVTFEPDINTEAPEGQLYEPIPFAATMNINTTLGASKVDLVGSTGGIEPVLELTYTVDDDETGTEYNVDLSSPYAGINFGTASIFEDWILEDSSEITLTFTNTGTAAGPLKVWLDEISTGYFSFVEEDPAVTFPLEINANASKSIKMMYAPSPEGDTNTTYDLGQGLIQHTGGNGPENRLTFMGLQAEEEAVQLYVDGSKLKPDDNSNPPYTEEKRKSLCVLLIGGETVKNFSLVNNSKKFTLESTISLSGVTLVEEEEDDSALNIKSSTKHYAFNQTMRAPSRLNIVSDGSFSFGNSSLISASLSNTSLTTAPGSESSFSITFTLDEEVPEGATITGLVEITNEFLDADYGVTPSQYVVYFTAKASESSVCSGGNGDAIDGDAKMITDRVTMILESVDLARNPPPFKAQFGLHFDKANRYVWMGPITYDPINFDPDDMSVFKIFNHQGTSLQTCYPLPTNPYVTEDKPGSFTGNNCSYTENGFTVDGSEACMSAKPFEPYTDTTTGKTIYVGHHYAIKMDPDTCEPEFEAKIATIHLEEGETIEDVFAKMVEQYGTDGSEEEYASVTGTYQFDSYIHFYKDYYYSDPASGITCDYKAGDILTGDPDAIKSCWTAFKDNTAVSLTRTNGMVETCSWWYFETVGGCVPQNAPGSENHTEYLCDDSSIDYYDSDTHVGFGPYEPYVDPITEEEDDTKWDMTINNIHLPGPFPINALNGYFPQSSRIMFADLYITLTTKAIDNLDLIAKEIREDFSEDYIHVSLDDTSMAPYYTEDSPNAEFTVADDGTGDDVDCFDVEPLTPCRGNYLLLDDNHLALAGEPIDFNNNMRFLVVGYTSFRGPYATGQYLAPSFASAYNANEGKPLPMTIHGCLNTEDNPSADTGCYDYKWDDEDIMRKYADPSHGMITTANTNSETGEVDTNAYINFKIFNDDRNRYVDYYNYPNHYYYDTNHLVGTCGWGN